jgi:hypothetical protein
MIKAIEGGFVVAAVFVAACASNPGRSSVAVPLEIPEPPPRVEIAPVPAVEAMPPERPVPAVLPPAKVSLPPATSAGASAGPSSTAPAAAAPVAPLPEPARPAPGPELQPAGSAGRTPTAAQVRDSLGRTKQKLDLLDRRRLNAGRRADYDSARRFLAQAEAAVAANNLLLAQSSAEKAETLANGLK